MRADEAKETGWGQVMQVLEVLSRSFRAKEFGLYPTCRVELLEAFYPGHCSDAHFKKIPLQKCEENWRSGMRKEKGQLGTIQFWRWAVMA